jgi:hypothetical protein
MRIAPIAALVMLGMALVPREAARAQSLPRNLEANVDVGTAKLTQANTVTSSVVTLGSQIRFTGVRGAFALNGIAASAADNGWTAQGVVSASLYAPPLRPRRWEITATASAFGLTGEAPTSSAQLVAREHITVGRGGLFAGVGGGGIVREQRWRHALTAHAGGYTRLGERGTDQLSAAFSLTDTQSEIRIPVEFFGIDHVTNPAAYADVLGYWQRDRAQLELLIGGGARFDVRGAKNADAWASASAAWWVTPHVALVVAGGRALADIVRGVPTTRYASIALRLGLHERSRALFAPRRPPLDPDAPRLTVERSSGGTCVLRVHAVADSSVEMMADFTDWEPVALYRDLAARDARDAWIAVRPLAPGTHRVALRIDGGAWTVPANLPRVDDDFGGAVGLVTIP